jgi:hypothetical protein
MAGMVGAGRTWPGTARASRRRLLGGLVGGAALAALPRAASAQCELVELHPGYPLYRGYVTGVDGPGDNACLQVLEANHPGFDRAAEDAANAAAAGRLGLAGEPEDWIWENWMAVEAERGLPPTCYSCAIFNAGSHTGPPGPSPVPPDDPRLVIGGYGTTRALDWIAAQRGVSSPYLGNLFPFDHNLRALVWMANPGAQWNAAQVLEGGSAVVEAVSTPGSGYYDPAALLDNLLGQGGYAPTAATASPEDQVFMVGVGVETLSRFAADPYANLLMGQFNRAVTGWRLETMRNPAAPSFAQWLRETGALGV